MPTLLRQFPEIARSGTQQTAYIVVPQRFDDLLLVGQAADAVLSDPANAVRFEVLSSQSGTGLDEVIIQVENWQGGLFIPKGGTTPISRPINIGFGPVPDTGFLALRAIFSRPMVVGATLTGLP